MTEANKVDFRKFRNALGNFATGVTIVTAKDIDSGYVGTTASSFNSVSLEPPMILWSIDKRARSLPAYQQAEHFVVNILAADQLSLSNHFAAQKEDKFKNVDYQLNPEGVPFIDNCAARFECKTASIYEGGDHLIIVGEVLRFDDTGRDALLFHRGSYAVSELHPCNKTKSQQDSHEGCFADDYLHYLVGKLYHQVKDKFAPKLRREGLSENEYRILASLSGREHTDLETLSSYSVLSQDVLPPILSALESKGLIFRTDDPELGSVALSQEGSDMLVSLLCAAKDNEAECLGSFNSEEAVNFKYHLKRMVEWNA